MHCIILLPDAAGRVPTAQELRQRGFAVSEAVEPVPMQAAVGLGERPPTAQRALALAAEAPARYGRQRLPER